MASALGFAHASAAFAAPSAEACIDAHTQGQLDRRAEKLLAARDKFVSCAVDACPSLVRKDCAEFAAEVNRSIPTLVLSAVDSDGRDVSDVTATIDGKTVATRLEGQAIAVDPGDHRVRFVTSLGVSQELRIVAAEGEKARRVLFQLPPGPARKETQRSQSPSLLPYVFVGVGVVALGSFTYFALSGKAKERELERCAPDCEENDVESMRTRYLVADVSLGVAVVSLGTAGALFLFTGSNTDGEATSARVEVGVAPTRTGMGLFASGRF